ncbi:arabinan endo-1,5-alpha-L-arabinosidase [Arthrobacter sp. Z1-15]
MATGHIQPGGALESQGLRHAHDPTVVRSDDGTYWMFSTDALANSADVPAGVHVRRSQDLVTWEYAGTALDGVPGPAAQWTGAAGLWAPDVVRWTDGSWRMYYSASTFGSRTSAIGLAVAAHPGGPWTDRGLVLKTTQGESGHNAIDAAVSFDRSGDPWLAYGSFFDGIYTLKLDPRTGLAAEDGPGTLLARRPPSVDGAVEGAFILYRPQEDRYVLFLSYDSLFGTYNIRTAVAAEITGPYRDWNGHLLTEAEPEPGAAGTKILGSYGFPGGTRWLAPGHNSVFIDTGLTDTPFSAAGQEEDEYFMVHHVRFAEDPSQHTAHLRRLYFTAGGWPVASPQPFAGRETERLPDPSGVDGSWLVAQMDPLSTEPVSARRMTLASPELRASDGTPSTARVLVNGTEIDAVVFAGQDWAGGRISLCFSGIDAGGTAWFGTREGEL